MHPTAQSTLHYRTEEDKNKDWEETWRKDPRCGADYPLPDGSEPGECNPESENYCCSKLGFCAEGTEYTVIAQNVWIINQNKGKMFSSSIC